MTVLVVGGGVLGLMMAYELSSSGHKVVLLERGRLGQEASWAGGGIVSPLYPWRYSPPVTALAALAQQAYPALAQDLLAESGLDPELERCGMLMLDALDQRDALVWAQQQGQVMVLKSAEELPAFLPGLAAGFHQGLWMPDIANIRNPRLLQSLEQALRRRPQLQLREDCEVRGFILQQGRCLGVHLSTGEQLRADAVVVCSGAWSADLLRQAGAELPLRPVQGQMILYKLSPRVLPCMVMYQGRYLIPRRDGHILCGSTLEDVGFAKQTTEKALRELRASAEQLWPALRGQKPIQQWAGLRPGSPNGIPFIGELPQAKGLWVNAGQFRNGLVLAPASARLLVDLMLGRPPCVDPRPYQIMAST